MGLYKVHLGCALNTIFSYSLTAIGRTEGEHFRKHR